MFWWLFLWFWVWLIGQGKSIFENAVGNRQTLSELNQTNGNDWEGLSDIPTDIYKKKTENNMPQGNKKNLKIIGEEWNEDENNLKNKFLKVYVKFGVQ